MSSFWNLFGGTKDAGEPQEAGASQDPAAGTSVPPASLTKKASSLPPPPALPPKSQPRYGIDDAIKLMRSLPFEGNVELIVRVVKRTLESLSVKVSDIIEDAARRQEQLRGKIAEYRTHITEFEREIESRRQEIARLEEELAETSAVRERLEMTESIGPTPIAPEVTPRVPPPPIATVSKPPPPPDKRFEPLPARPAAPFRPKLGSQTGSWEKKPSVPPPPPTPIPGEEEEETIVARDIDKD